MAGLVDEQGGSGEAQVTTMGNGLDSQTDVQSFESHLDSFIEGSGWTREDLLLVLTLLEVVALTALAYSEVS